MNHRVTDLLAISLAAAGQREHILEGQLSYILKGFCAVGDVPVLTSMSSMRGRCHDPKKEASL
jgi:hypothetical protein